MVMIEDVLIVDDIRNVEYFRHPYRLNLMLISFIERGSIRGKADLLDFHAHGPSLLFLFPNELIEYKEASDDLRIKVIVMSEAFSKTLHNNESFSAFFRLKENPVVKLQECDFDVVKEFIMLLSTIEASENVGKRKALNHLFTSFFYMVSNFKGYMDVVNVGKSHHKLLLERFYDELKAHYKESMEVKFYADKLCMSPKYMAQIIKKVSGKSAKQWIGDYIILESKALMLNNPKLTLLEISETLGFPNQSFFTQFFKKHTGVTPSQYLSFASKTP